MEAAVIATGGKQYRVTPGQVTSVEQLAGEPGESVAFTSVMLVTRDDEDSVREAAGTLEGWQLMELGWDTRGAYIERK